MIETPPDFSEADYLAANPDVAAAVLAGELPSGEHHYTLYGVYEHRVLKPGPRPAPLPLPFPDGAPVSRRDKVLANLDLEKLEGMEIGALASPLVKPSEGRILFVDFADTEALKATYASDTSVNTDEIVEVNGIWGAQTLQQCLGEDRKVDFVVASHVIEHTPDLITWLEEIRSVLKPGGSVRLAVPDRRYTFDYLRYESRIHDVLDAYLHKARAPTPRMIIDFCSLVRHVDCPAAWNGALDPSNLPPLSSMLHGFELAKATLADGTYFDTHCWVFTPASFVDLCLQIADLGLLKMACSGFITTARNDLEFFVHMTPSESKADILKSWNRVKAALPQTPPGGVIETG